MMFKRDGNNKKEREVLKRCIEVLKTGQSAKVGVIAYNINGIDKDYDFWEKIADKLCLSGEYEKVSVDAPYIDFFVIKNKNYKPRNWNERHPVLYDMFKLSAAAIIGGLTTILFLPLTREKPLPHTHSPQDILTEPATMLEDSQYNTPAAPSDTVELIVPVTLDNKDTK